ncbi:energy transducer TonB [Opitutaceae bacterium]|jgi:protein TonB|nr:energy transducer TonB [Opitutaceae bacterium]
MSASPDLLELDLDPASGWGRQALKWSAGAGMSGLILLTLAYVQKTDFIEPAPPIANLQNIVLEPPPPPPPEIAMREPPPPTVLDLEPLPSDNIIKIAVAPLTYEVPLPEAEPILEISLDAIRPDSLNAERNPDHIFQYRDVDQHPVVTSRVKPNINSRDMDGGRDKRVVVSMVVTRAGVARNISLVESSGRQTLDDKVLEALIKWKFRPALRNGVPVNCLVIQSVRIKPSRSNSPFGI